MCLIYCPVFCCNSKPFFPSKKAKCPLFSNPGCFLHHKGMIARINPPCHLMSKSTMHWIVYIMKRQKYSSSSTNFLFTLLLNNLPTLLYFLLNAFEYVLKKLLNLRDIRPDRFRNKKVCSDVCSCY